MPRYQFVDLMGGVDVSASRPIQHAIEAARYALFDVTSVLECPTPLLKTRGP